MGPLFEKGQNVVFYKAMFGYESAEVPRLEIDNVYKVDNPEAYKNPYSGRIYISLVGIGTNWGYIQEQFRPISDCGPAICEWIEETAFKEYQLEEAIKQ